MIVATATQNNYRECQTNDTNAIPDQRTFFLNFLCMHLTYLARQIIGLNEGEGEGSAVT